MIEVLIGMIASGKSTYSSMRAREGAVIANDDSIVMALHGHNYKLYDKALKGIYKRIMINIIIDGAIMKKDIIVDATNHNKQTRRRYVDLAKTLDQKVVAVVFPRENPEVHGKRRWESDSRGVDLNIWCEIAASHDSHYEEPSKEEGFDEIRYITFDDIRSKYSSSQ